MEEGLSRWFAASYVSQITSGIFQRLGTFTRFSFIGRLAGRKEKSVILDNSKFVLFAAKALRCGCSKVSFYLGLSGLARAVADIKKGLIVSSLKTGGLMLTAAAATDITLTLIFKKGITPAGWFVRVMLLFLGFCALRFPAGWDELKGTSFFFKQRGPN
jgi:hypothetical protein